MSRLSPNHMLYSIRRVSAKGEGVDLLQFSQMPGPPKQSVRWKPCRPARWHSVYIGRAFLFMKDFAKRFYKSAAWRGVREYCMHRDSFLCQDCLAEGRYTSAEEVHHIIELTPENIDDQSISLNPDNLVSLCRECHRARHAEKKTRYEVDELGRVKIL